jgi:hypothetical protein
VFIGLSSVAGTLLAPSGDVKKLLLDNLPDGL